MAERLSVVALAVRLRLNGSHAAPRGAVWYHVGHAFAMIILLYQAVVATASAGFSIAIIIQSSGYGSTSWYDSFPLWSRFAGLLWIPAFICFVLRRFVAARVLAMLAVAAGTGVNLTIVAMYGLSQEPIGLGDLSRWGWLAVSAAVVFVTPPDAKASRRFWFGAYLLGSLLFLLANLRTLVGPITRDGPWAQFGNPGNISALALSLALAVVLVRSWPIRRGSPHWLLALAIVAGGIGGVRLARLLTQPNPPFDPSSIMVGAAALDATLLGLAVVALVVGLLAWRRLPTAGPLSSDT